MGNNRLAIAGAALLILGGLIAWQVTSRHSEESSSAPSVKLPKVDKTKVDTLEISNPGQPTVVLVKQGETWAMSQPLASPVEDNAIEAALTKLAELEVDGIAATRKENHERLEVSENTGVRVVAKQGGKAIIDLLVGKYASGNTMVREQGADKVASVKGSIRYAFAKEVKDWREHSMASFDVASAQELAFVSEKGSFKFKRAAESWVQAEGAAVAELDGSKVQSLASTLSGLRATDFADAGVTLEQAGLAPTPAATVTVTTGGDAGTQQVILRVGAVDGDARFVQVEGNPVIFKLSKATAERFMPDAESLKKSAAPPPSAPPAGGGPSIQGLPPGVQLPPDILQQLQQQQQGH